MKILCVPPQTLTKKEKDLLLTEKIFVIETYDPTKIVMQSEVQPMNGNELALAAIRAIRKADSYDGYREMTSNIIAAITKNLTP